MKKIIVLGICFVLLSKFAAATSTDTTELHPKAMYGREAHVIVAILNDKHYRKLIFNDSLSSVVLDRYLQDLDNSKSYFLEADVKGFEKYRFALDDQINAENVEPAYAIYDLFRRRYQERMDYVMNTLIKQDFDYSVDESYETDREHAAWAHNAGDLNDLWRKVIKNQELTLKLAGKKPEDIKEIIRKRYERFDKSFIQFTSEDVFSIFMNCVTEAYDAHTSYFSPKASEVFKQQMSLSLEGIGAQLQTENDYTKVTKILPGGPAEKSNKLFVNDLITGVAQGKDGEMVDVIGWRIDEVVKLIKGPKGTIVRLNVLSAATGGVNSRAEELTFVRDKIKLEDQSAKKSTIKYQVNGKSVTYGVITLPSFYMDFEQYAKGDTAYRSTTRDVKRLIKELKTTGIDGLVIDLRNNGGGALPEAIDLTGLFIKQGPVVQVKNYLQAIDVMPDEDPDVTYAGPLVVLTNRFSASASEIFAGAIQDYQRGVIVGESTFGKGTVQSVVDLNRVLNSSEMGELHLTIQKFYRVTGSSTQHKGVLPDVKLPSALKPNQFGESSNPSAMPWDVISATPFQKTNDVNDRMLASLNKLYQERLKSDAGLKKYAAEAEELKKSMAETKVSLNEAKRRQEMNEAESRKAALEKLNTKVSKEGLPANDVEKVNDEYLRESFLILTDMISNRIG